MEGGKRMNQAMFLSAVRYALVAAGTYAVAKGWIPESQVEPFIGGGLALAAMAWGIWRNRSPS